jgi:hypothetical protein
MNKKRLTLIAALLLCLYALVACEPETVTETVEVTRVVTEQIEVEGETVEVTRVVVEERVDVVTATPGVRGNTAADTVAASQPAERLIIKNGRMEITVMDTDEATESAALRAQEFGGYVLSQQIWEGDGGFRYAQLSLAVPVAQFENALRAFRTLGSVTHENASGQDVTEEYVDLDSRLGNLQATQTRLRSFLDQATNVTETLAIDRELRQIEEELELIQGRMTYLAGRAAFSTIDLTLNPLIPTPTPSPSPTPTPLPTAEVWRPGDTAQLAAVQLQETAQDTADFTIFYAISCGPWLVAFAFLGWLLWWLRRLVRRVRPIPAMPVNES